MADKVKIKQETTEVKGDTVVKGEVVKTITPGPEMTGAEQITPAEVQAAGWFGVRKNNHNDAEYSVPGLVSGGSPGDRDTAYDAPGGVDPGSGSYDG